MKRLLTSALLLFSFALVGCDSDDPAAEEITNIRMLPENATMVVGDTTEFSIVAVTASGDVLENHNLDVRWWPSDPDVFTVDDDGTAIARGVGSAFCIAEASTPTKVMLRFTGRDSAFVTVSL